MNGLDLLGISFWVILICGDKNRAFLIGLWAVLCTLIFMPR